MFIIFLGFTISFPHLLLVPPGKSLKKPFFHDQNMLPTTFHQSSAGLSGLSNASWRRSYSRLKESMVQEGLKPYWILSSNLNSLEISSPAGDFTPSLEFLRLNPWFKRFNDPKQLDITSDNWG